MKKIIAVAITFVLMLVCVFMSACSAKSNAVTRDELIRENFAAEKEAEDDAKGREHIEIPADADTIDIDEEEWIVIRSIEEFENKIFHSDGGTEKNYILANDIELKNWSHDQNTIFQGKFNGNNFKFYGKEESKGIGSSLFFVVRNAVLENIIFSSSDGFYFGAYFSMDNVLLARVVENSSVKNCTNYFQPKIYRGIPITSSEIYDQKRYGGLISSARNCVIENCVNYADFYSANGSIVEDATDCVIRNCKNYGNLSSEYVIGGIVGTIYEDTLIENCENYGKIVGTIGVGGIVGCTVDFHGEFICFGFKPNSIEAFMYFNGDIFTDNQIVSNCKNYGDIYVLKEDGSSKVEEIDRSNVVLTNKVLLFGGIAGSISKVENCENYGNFYGLESVGKKVTVHFIGGVVGVARKVENCTNTGTMVIQKGKAKNVGDIFGYNL